MGTLRTGVPSTGRGLADSAEFQESRLGDTSGLFRGLDLRLCLTHSLLSACERRAQVARGELTVSQQCASLLCSSQGAVQHGLTQQTLLVANPFARGFGLRGFGARGFSVRGFSASSFGANSFRPSTLGTSRFGVTHCGVSSFGARRFGTSTLDASGAVTSGFGVASVAVGGFARCAVAARGWRGGPLWLRCWLGGQSSGVVGRLRGCHRRDAQATGVDGVTQIGAPAIGRCGGGPGECRHGFEARWIAIGHQPTWRVGFERTARCQRLQCRGHPGQRGLRGRVVLRTKQVGGERAQPGEGSALVGACAELTRADACCGPEQRFEVRALAPPQLVDHPRGHRRSRRLPQRRRSSAISCLAQLGGQPLALCHERVQRRGVQDVQRGFEVCGGKGHGRPTFADQQLVP